MLMINNFFIKKGANVMEPGNTCLFVFLLVTLFGFDSCIYTLRGNTR